MFQIYNKISVKTKTNIKFNSLMIKIVNFNNIQSVYFISYFW